MWGIDVAAPRYLQSKAFSIHAQQHQFYDQPHRLEIVFEIRLIPLLAM